MSSYTNMQVPNRYGQVESLRKQLATKEAELNFLNETLNRYEEMFLNIHRAIAEFGYIELADDVGKNKIKLGLIP